MKTTSDEDRSCQFGKTSAHTVHFVKVIRQNYLCYCMLCCNQSSFTTCKNGSKVTYPGTAEGAGGESSWCSTDRARPDKQNRGEKNPQWRVVSISNINAFGVRCLEHNTRHVLFYFLFTIMCHLYLWLCAAVSKALRVGVGDPCSVTLRTSRLFLSGRQRPWRVSIGESTRFRGGSAEEHYHKVITGALQRILTQQGLLLRCSCVSLLLLSFILHLFIVTKLVL